MAFEPLQTDEKLENPVARPPDMDAAMLFGCSGFVLSSIGGYMLSVWPFLVFQETEKLTTLATAAAIGLTPAAILGIVSTRKFRLAGACGFVGSALSVGIFLYLRIEQTFISSLARQAPAPDYPKVVMYLAPLGWILISAILGLLFLPKQEED